MPRLFIAIDLPETVKHTLNEILPDFPGIRPVRPGQIHLTLRFIGDTDEKFLEGIKHKLESVRTAPFLVQLKGVGCFPSPKKARVVWVGLNGGAALPALRNAVEEAVVACGIPAETRDFFPHITTGRLRAPREGEVRRYLESHAAFTSETFEVRVFHLFSSTLNPGGAVHTIEASYPLEP